MGSGLQVADVTKSFDGANGKVDVLRGVTLSMSPGETLGITGQSGSGKSTLLHLIGGLDAPSSGAVTVDGVDPFALRERDLARFRNKSVGFVFQDHHLLPQYSVLENALIPTLPFGGAEPGADGRARDLIDRVGLSHRIGHRPGELSGGERQRAAVARALINSPNLLLCDEPTGNLDPETAADVTDLLLALQGDGQTILIVVTHNLDLAARFSRHARMEAGVCVEA
jgi:lipoprotein-releasing system ATP-binding protein